MERGGKSVLGIMSGAAARTGNYSKVEQTEPYVKGIGRL